jgi:hypothetical protein
MADLLGKNIWARRCGRCKAEGSIPRRTRSAQRRREAKLWSTNDQEVPYYWHPTADIEEDYEADCRHGCNGDCTANGSEHCTITCH